MTDIMERLEATGGKGQGGPLKKEAADEIRKLRAIIASAQAAWQPIETRPEFDHQPGRQFILLEGACHHSGANWHRQFAGEAYIRKPEQPDEMLQYRINDILRICHDGDIDPHTATVTHWMPGAYPHFPSSLSSAERACVCQEQHRRGYCTEPGCPHAQQHRQETGK
jgi:hypothetical protein